LQCFERAKDMAPDRPETACALGREHMRRGNSERALQLLTAAWQPEHSLLTAGTSLARCLGLDLGKLDQAHQILDEVDEAFGPELGTRLIRGELLLEGGRHEEAAVLAEDLLSADVAIIAHSATLLMSRIENERGRRAAKQHAHERAIFAFKRSGDLDPKWAAPRNTLGASFEILSRFQRAEAAYREAIALDPHYAAAWHNLARLYLRRRDARALESFEQAYLADSAHPEISADYCIALTRADAREHGEAVLRAHAEEWGDTAEAWVHLAMAMANRGAGELAHLCVLKAGERKSPSDLSAHVLAILNQCIPEQADLGSSDS
jgi:tetratricopeptide (TPR) repeat protein